MKNGKLVCADKTDASIMHKLIRLRSLLRGEAEELLDGLGWESSDYYSAWKIIEDEYGGDERFINRQMDLIRDVKQVKTREDIRQFSRRLNTCVVTLKNRRRYDELEAGMLHSVVKSKLSPRLLETYYTWLDYQHRRSTLESLRDWLLVYSRHKVQAQEDVEGVLKNDQERRPNRRNNTYASAQNNRKTTSICFKCNKKHYISN